MQDFLRWLHAQDRQMYAAFDARSVDVNGRPLHELPEGELWSCLESIRLDLIAASPSSRSADLVASGVELAL